MEIVSFLLGIIFAYTQSIYTLFFAIIFMVLRGRLIGIAFFFIFGFSWGLLHHWLTQDKGMPAVKVLSKVELLGTIDSIPLRDNTKSQFYFALKQLDGQAVHTFVLLSCYRHCPVFKVGETWQFKAKLQRPRNLGNPGHYNFVAKLGAEHIYWQGYIKPPFINLKKGREEHYLLKLRESLVFGLNQLIPEKTILGVFQALTFGITTHLRPEDWNLFRRTGTTHLMVISGSHIGLIAGFCYWLSKWLWSRSSRLCLRIPAPKIASMMGFLMACSYSLLTGFAPPAQRALVASFFFFSKNFINRCYIVD